MQKLGQHFLKNKSIIQKMIEVLNPQDGDVLLEIGPGHGELTLPLAAACEKIGAKVIAIEKDLALAQGLEARDEGRGKEEFEVIHGDALKFIKDFPRSSPHAPHSFKLVGNIPYYITGHLLRIVSELKEKPKVCIFTIQKEVAERIVAIPPKMNRLAASVQYWAQPEIIASIPRTYFSPQPSVDSALLKLDARHPKSNNQKQYYAAVRALFAQPRKTVLNNLADDALKNKEKISPALLKLGIDPGLRPQNLTVEDIEKIAGVLF